MAPTEVEPAATDESSTALPTDTLAGSVLLLLVLTVVQRLVGFLRGLLFCRWLDPVELGEWDVIFAFLELAAPVAVLGIPGSFGRYVEHYRQRGQLRTFLRRTTTLVGLLIAVALLGMYFAAPLFSQLIFGRGDEARLIYLTAGCLAAVIVHNAVGELFAALRMFRVATVLQFAHALAFAALGIALLHGWSLTASSVLAAYGGACALCALGATMLLRKVWRALPRRETPLAQSTLWGKLVPFAAWTWLANWLTNLFVITDRYMILHTSGLPPEEALALVGQYHSSRVLPVMLVSVAGLFATLVVPHLSHDWEAGRRREVSKKMLLTMKLSGLAMLAAATGIHLLAPWLFQLAFDDKYTLGLNVLPGTLLYCTWFALVTVVQCYLWCAERARLSSVGLGLGVVVNVALNLFLLPRFGLVGAVTATVAANGIALVAIYWFCHNLGMGVDRGLCVITAAPLTLCLPPLYSLLFLVALGVAAVVTDWIINRDEKLRLAPVAAEYAARLRRES